MSRLTTPRRSVQFERRPSQRFSRRASYAIKRKLQEQQKMRQPKVSVAPTIKSVDSTELANQAISLSSTPSLVVQQAQAPAPKPRTMPAASNSSGSDVNSTASISNANNCCKMQMKTNGTEHDQKCNLFKAQQMKQKSDSSQTNIANSNNNSNNNNNSVSCSAPMSVINSSASFTKSITNDLRPSSPKELKAGCKSSTKKDICCTDEEKSHLLVQLDTNENKNEQDAVKHKVKLIEKETIFQTLENSSKSAPTPVCAPVPLVSTQTAATAIQQTPIASAAPIQHAITLNPPSKLPVNVNKPVNASSTSIINGQLRSSNRNIAIARPVPQHNLRNLALVQHHQQQQHQQQSKQLLNKPQPIMTEI